MARIYVASSWRNVHQPDVVRILREAGHEVYDFRNPGEGKKGFSWSDIDPNWKNWTPAEFIKALEHPLAVQGYTNDKEGMDWCTHCLLVLPSGNSAHLEAGWCAGKGKDVAVYIPEHKEAELMYKLIEDITGADEWLYHIHMDGVLDWLKRTP